MAVVYRTTASDREYNTSTTGCSVSLAASGTDRIAIIFVRALVTGSTQAWFNTPTVDGNAATQIGSDYNPTGDTWMRAYYYLNPPTTSVAYTVSTDDISVDRDISMQVLLYSGVNQTSPIDTNNTGTATGNLTLSATAGGNNCLLASMSRNTGSGPMTAGAGTTIRGSEVSMSCGDSNTPVASGSQSMTWNAGGSTSFGIIVAIAPVSSSTTDIKGSSLASGLQAYWDFEEASGTRYDLTASAQNLTDINTVTSSASGKIGTCAVFEDANSEKFTVADSASVSVDDTWSLSYWLYIDSTKVGGAGDSHASIGKRSADNGFLHYVQNDAGTWYLYVASGSGTFSSTKVNVALSTNTWYHVVTYYNGASTKAYINGSSNTINVPAITDPAVDLEIGGGGGYLTWAGMIDELGIWNRELTQTDVDSLYASGAGLPYYDPTDIKNDATLSTSLVSYWKLDETSGNRADSHGSNTLSDNNTVLYGTGKINNAGDFERATTEYLSKTSAIGVPTTTGSRSISAWINLESDTPADAYNAILDYGAEGVNQEYGLILTQISGVKGIGMDKYGALLTVNWTPSLSTWYHVISTYDGTNIKIYINGVYLGSVAGGTINTTNTNPLLIGARSTTPPTQHFDGLIDETALYSKALTVAEVRALYGYGTPPEYEATASSSIKTINGLAYASVKTVNGLSIASVKTVNGLA